MQEFVLNILYAVANWQGVNHKLERHALVFTIPDGWGATLGTDHGGTNLPPHL